MAVNIVDRIDDGVKVNNVIVSVSDKTGLEELAPALIGINPSIRIYSTGGTYKHIAGLLGQQSDRNLVPVSLYTGQPEMQGGLVKTLDFKIYLGLLSETYNEDHAGDLERTNAAAIDMAIVNLYPFRETVAAADATPERARANIDIGGPCMVRASAKNYLRVASVTDPRDYGRVVSELRDNGGSISLKTRFELACKAFRHTAEYDAAISKYLSERRFDEVAGCYSIQD